MSRATGPLVAKPRPRTAPMATTAQAGAGLATADGQHSTHAARSTVTVVQRVRSMSDIAVRPKATKARVVASTTPAASPVRSPKSRRPRRTVASTTPSADNAGTRRAAQALGPNVSKAAAMSQ